MAPKIPISLKAMGGKYQITWSKIQGIRVSSLAQRATGRIPRADVCQEGKMPLPP